MGERATAEYEIEIPEEAWAAARTAAIMIDPDMLPGNVRTIARTIAWESHKSRKAAEAERDELKFLLDEGGQAYRAISDLEAERDALRTRVEEMGDLVGELHRLGLVLESAVRNADEPNHPAVLALIRRARSALSQEGQG